MNQGNMIEFPHITLAMWNTTINIINLNKIENLLLKINRIQI